MTKHSTEKPVTALRSTPSHCSGTNNLVERYTRVRRASEVLCKPLEVEDFVIQSMPDTSPTRWHLAHTTWFFETLVLAKAGHNYRPFRRDYRTLFNSYYNTIGTPFPRRRRGLLSRPTVREVFDYRAHVDEQMCRLLEQHDPAIDEEMATVIMIGVQHEEQHQELILTDIKHAFSCNPLCPVYKRREDKPLDDAPPLSWIRIDEGIREIGFAGDTFAYDNERPRHRVFVESFELANRLVTNTEFLEFIDDGGYERPELWLSDGWNAVQQHEWKSPLYWQHTDDQWRHFTLAGLHTLNLPEPVSHVSYYEADAFARWYGALLPRETSWETACVDAPIRGNFAENGRYHPSRVTGDDRSLTQVFGDLWEWTASPYVAYPGFRAPKGPLGEYNGKFMCNQMVLRGGSCATPQSHIRPSYRNFFPPDTRWQFTGIRLARQT